LESTTEYLSRYLETDIDEYESDLVDDIKALKEKGVNHYKHCELRRKNLVQHVYDGQEDEEWKYHD